MKNFLKEERNQKGIGLIALIIAIVFYNVFPSLLTGGILLTLAVIFYYLGCGEDKRKEEKK